MPARPRGPAASLTTAILAVSVLAFRDGRLLAMRRSRKKKAAPGAWEVLSGRVEPLEAPRDAAQREAREESGFDVTLDPGIVAAYLTERAGRDMLVIAYRATAPAAAEPVLSDEHDDGRFVTLDEFARLCPFPKLVAVARRAAGEPAAVVEHVLVWEFLPAEGREAEFEAAYGPDGDWARFFRRDPAYIRTDVLQGSDGRYVTLDRWTSRAAFEAFREREREAYAALDRRMEALTRHEAPIGAFDEVECGP
jgi:8-oxo-dGTP pyrophosphatase MutT (NUDIX family)